VYTQPGDLFLPELCDFVAHRAPECNEGAWDARADVWSLGLLLLEVLVGTSDRRSRRSLNLCLFGFVYFRMFLTCVFVRHRRACLSGVRRRNGQGLSQARGESTATGAAAAEKCQRRASDSHRFHRAMLITGIVVLSLWLSLIDCNVDDLVGEQTTDSRSNALASIRNDAARNGQQRRRSDDGQQADRCHWHRCAACKSHFLFVCLLICCC
jgi:hypothetical protein